MNYKYFNHAIPSISNEDNIKPNSIVYVLSGSQPTDPKKYLAYELEVFFENYNSIATNPYSPTNANYGADAINNYEAMTPIANALNTESSLGYTVERILIKTVEDIWFDYTETKAYIDLNKDLLKFPNTDLESDKLSLSQFINDVYNVSTIYPIDINISEITIHERMDVLFAVGKYMFALDPNELDNNGTIIMGHINNYYYYDDDQRGIMMKEVKKFDGMKTGEVISGGVKVIDNSGQVISLPNPGLNPEDIQFSVTFDSEDLDLENMIMFYKGIKYTINDSTIDAKTDKVTFWFDTIETKLKEDMLADANNTPDNTLTNGFSFIKTPYDSQHYLGNEFIDITDVTNYTLINDGFIGCELKINNGIRNTITGQQMVFYKGKLVDSSVRTKSDGTKFLFINKNIMNVANDIDKLTISQFGQNGQIMNIKYYHDIDMDESTAGLDNILSFKNMRSDSDFINRTELFINGIRKNFTILTNHSIKIHDPELTSNTLEDYLKDNDIRLVSITPKSYYAYEPEIQGFESDNYGYTETSALNIEEGNPVFNIFVHLQPMNSGQLIIDTSKLIVNTGAGVNAAMTKYPFYIIRENKKMIPIKFRTPDNITQGVDGGNGGSLSVSIQDGAISHKFFNGEVGIPVKNASGSVSVRWIQSYMAPNIETVKVIYPDITPYSTVTLGNTTTTIQSVANSIEITFTDGCRNLNVDETLLKVYDTNDDNKELTILNGEFTNAQRNVYKITFEDMAIDQHLNSASNSLTLDIKDGAFYDSDMIGTEKKAIMDQDYNYTMNIDEPSFSSINFDGVYLVNNVDIEADIMTGLTNASFKVKSFNLKTQTVEYFILKEPSLITLDKIDGSGNSIESIPLDTSNITYTNIGSNADPRYLINVPFLFDTGETEKILDLGETYKLSIDKEFVHNFDVSMNQDESFEFTVASEDNTVLEVFNYIVATGSIDDMTTNYGGYLYDMNLNTPYVDLWEMKCTSNEVNGDTAKTYYLDDVANPSTNKGYAPYFVCEFAKWVELNNPGSGIFKVGTSDPDDRDTIEKSVLKRYLWKMFKGDDWVYNQNRNYTEPIMAHKDDSDWQENGSNIFNHSSTTETNMFGFLDWTTSMKNQLDEDNSNFARYIKNKVVDTLKSTHAAVYISRDCNLPGGRLGPLDDFATYDINNLNWKLIVPGMFIKPTSTTTRWRNMYTWLYNNESYMNIDPYYWKEDSNDPTQIDKTEAAPTANGGRYGTATVFPATMGELDSKVRLIADSFAYIDEDLDDDSVIGKLWLTHFGANSGANLRIKFKWDETFDFTSQDSDVMEQTGIKYDINERYLNEFVSMFSVADGSN